MCIFLDIYKNIIKMHGPINVKLKVLIITKKNTFLYSARLIKSNYNLSNLSDTYKSSRCFHDVYILEFYFSPRLVIKHYDVTNTTFNM
jgi:hypothetical protein